MKALGVAFGIVFWTLVLGTAFLYFFPGGDAEPVAILQIEPAPEPSPGGAPPVPEAEAPAPEAQAPAAAPPAETSPDLPPGFAVGPPDSPQAPSEPQGGAMMPMPQGENEAPPAPAQPAPEDAAPQPAPDPDQQGDAAPAPSAPMQQAALDSPASATPPPAPPPENETGSIALPSAPEPELVEQSQYGPLPKIAANGRRSIDAYARPSKYAAAAQGAPARVAILVTGLGLPEGPPQAALKGLPVQVSVAYGAYARSLQDAVADARAEGHEVLLQIPLEPQNYPTVDPGPHTLITTLPPADNIKRLQWLMSRYTGYVGVTNHMGAKFQASAESMTPVLEELKRRGLLYVDGEAVKDSATEKAAKAIGLDYFAVNVQLDAGDTAQQLAKLEQAAKERGTAIGVVRLKPAIAKQITDWAAKLEGKGIVLVPVSAAVRSQAQG